MKKMQTATSICMALLMVMIGSNVAQTENLTGAKGLVIFNIPDGWDNERFQNGRNFTRAGLPDDPNILGVVAERRDAYMTMDAMRAGRKQVYAAQGWRVVFEEVSRINGFEVWEAVNEANIRDQDVVFHHYLMFSETLMVDVHLNASKNVYVDYLPDLRSLVNSIRATDAATTGAGR